MLSRLSRRLSYANVMSTIAVFVAVGTGGAYAANTIGSSDIIDGQVNSADVKDQSLTTFDVSTFLGADIVDGTITGDDVADNSSLGPAEINEQTLSFANTLTGNDLGPGSVRTSEVADGTLTGLDIGKHEFVNFAANIGTVPAQSCVYSALTGIDAQGEHLFLTPAFTNNAFVTYEVEYRTDDPGAYIKACNPTTTAKEGGNPAHFNLLVVDAQ